MHEIQMRSKIQELLLLVRRFIEYQDDPKTHVGNKKYSIEWDNDLVANTVAQFLLIEDLMPDEMYEMIMHMHEPQYLETVEELTVLLTVFKIGSIHQAYFALGLGTC